VKAGWYPQTVYVQSLLIFCISFVFISLHDLSPIINKQNLSSFGDCRILKNEIISVAQKSSE